MNKAVFGALLCWSVCFSFATAHDSSEVTVIHMYDNYYEPDNVTIEVGQIVEFENSGTKERWPATNIHPSHTVYPNSNIADCGTDLDINMFDACRKLAPGESYTFIFTEPGVWKYHDHLNSSIGGTVTVTGEEEVSEEKKESIWNKVKGWFASLTRPVHLLYMKHSVDFAEVEVFGNTEDTNRLRDLIEVFGAEAVMDKLLTETGGGSEFDCHQEAHEIGRVAFEVYGMKVFAEGDASCHSGFYHGAMESMLVQSGTRGFMNQVGDICHDFNSQFGIFECLHGVGHGVLTYENYDLPTALDVCEELGDAWSILSCYGGVFMENIITAQGFGTVDAHETKWVKTDDLHFPCNHESIYGGRLEQCYMMQTSWMLHNLDYNFPSAIKLCESAPPEGRNECYLSIGRDAAGYTLRDPKRTLAICDHIDKPSKYYNDCVFGAVNVVIDFWGPKLGNQADEFCELVSDQAARDQCTDLVKRRKKDVFGG